MTRRARAFALVVGAAWCPATCAAVLVGWLSPAAALVGPATASAAPVDPILGVARLTGRFQLAGRITVATRVRGERVGQTFLRTWTFTPRCSSGACGAITLVRPRSGGRDRVILRRQSPGLYSGSGSFYVPLQCGGSRYAHGELASFSVTVRIDGAARDLATGEVLATHLNATYRNSSRRNLTPCVDFPGRDAARYHGHAVAG
jgi:hypothetical protein